MADSSKAKQHRRSALTETVAPAPSGAVLIGDLVRQHHAELYRYAYRLTGSVADAEDLTQQTFLIAQQKLEQLRDSDCANRWLFKILRNGYLKSRRKPIPDNLVDLGLDANMIASEIPDADQIDRDLLQAAVDRLPAEFKVVMLMFYFEERAYKDIADELGIPIGTVMSRLSRAKSHLRKRVQSAQVSTR